MIRPPLILTFLTLSATALAGQGTVTPVQPEDYGQWERLGNGVLSPDGAWLAVPISRVNEQIELRIRSTSRDSVIVVPFGSRPVFSKDARWVAYRIEMSPDEKKAAEEKEEPIRNDAGILDLHTGVQRTFQEIESFGFSGVGASLALERYPDEDDEDTRTMVVENLATGSRVSFGSVAELAWQDDGPLLAFTVQGEGDVGTGVQLYDASTGVVRTLDAEPARYARLSWRDRSADLAVLRSFSDETHDDSSHVILAWRDLGGEGRTMTFDPRESAVIGDGRRVVPYRPLTWSDDGRFVFFGVKEWEPAEEQRAENAQNERDEPGEQGEENTEDEEGPGPADMEIWRADDERTLPTQKRDEQQDEERNDLAVWHVDDGQVLMLSDDTVENPRVVSGGRLVLATNDDAYAFDAMFGRGRADVYAIDPATGRRTLAADSVTFPYGASPSGWFVHYYRNGEYYVFDRESASARSISRGAATEFANGDYDHPVDEKPAFGFAGWTEGDASVIVYDKYDVWELPVEGTPVRLTNGAGEKIIHRRVRLDPDEDAIDRDDLVLALRGEWSMYYGFARFDGDRVTRLVYQDDNVGRLQKAENADVFAYVVQDFDDSPDYFVTDGRFNRARQVTTTNPFQGDYAWGHSELVPYTNHNGRDLQAALFYPADYDPSQTYPMIVYIYEIRSTTAKTYYVPSQRNYYNPAVWTANGYFVLQPDIVFDTRDPGVSSARTLEAAVGAVVERGLVDRDRVGLVGHSWGGYQATFVPTATDIFAASVAGAGLTDLVSMYGAIFWVAGAPESGHFEVGQERMDVPYWVDPNAYMRNSAVFNVESLNTPLLLEVGDSDRNVDWRQSIELYNAARRARKPVTMLVYHGEDHGLAEEKNQADYQRRILEWFDHYLKGHDAQPWITDPIPWLQQKESIGKGQ